MAVNYVSLNGWQVTALTIVALLLSPVVLTAVALLVVVFLAVFTVGAPIAILYIKLMDFVL